MNTGNAAGLRPEDVEESFVRSAGAGGQNVNKVASCVQLIHRPTGIIVRCQEERSQAANRALAWRRLAEKIEAARRRVLLEREQAREKARRTARGPSRNAKRRMREEKAHRARVKRDRGTGRWDE